MSSFRPFGKILSSIWHSEKFRSLDAMDTRLAYFWLHTSYRTSAGVLRIWDAQLLEELDFVRDSARAKEILEELAAEGLIVVQRPFVVITQFLQASPVDGFRHAVGAFNEVLELPDGELKDALMDELLREKGSWTLRKWKDKDGRPHRLVHAIDQYRSRKIEEEAEGFASSSRTPREGFGKASAIIYNQKEKEKPDTREVVSPDQAQNRSEMRAKDAEGRLEGPLPETIQLANKLGGK